MLLKREVNGNIIKCLFDSSNVVASTYNKDTSNLEIIFKSGQKYLYHNVSYTNYFEFEIADSQGIAFNQTIKGHVNEKLDKIDPTKILEVAEKTKLLDAQETFKVRKKDLKGRVVNFLDEFDSYDDQQIFERVEYLQSVLKKFLNQTL